PRITFFPYTTLFRSLTLDSWNQNASVDSFAKSTHSSDDGFDYFDNSSAANISDEYSGDSLDKLQQASFDDEAIGNYTVEGDDYRDRKSTRLNSSHVK